MFVSTSQHPDANLDLSQEFQLPLSSHLDSVSPLPDILEDDDDDDDDLESFCDDQDDAQAVLQPAISALARRYTSTKTPALEKSAALESSRYDGFFDIPGTQEDGDSSPGGEVSPSSLPLATLQEEQSRSSIVTPEPNNQQDIPSLLPLTPPSPWVSRIDERQTIGKSEGGSRQSPVRSVLESAFGPSRRRSKSAGQEAWRRLQKAFPSITAPTNLFPSLSSSFLSNFSDKTSVSDASDGSTQQTTPSTTSEAKTSPPQSPLSEDKNVPSDSGQKNQAEPSKFDSRRSQVFHGPPRPKALRRVTSDESILYHSASRASSLGHDDQFEDQIGMVNMRLVALKESLPDLPSFKLTRPSLSKLQSASRRAWWSSNDPSTSRDGSTIEALGLQRQTSPVSKEDPAILDRVLETLTGDLVIMGGYRGSVLRSAEPPYQQVWAPMKLGFNMRRVNLEVGLDYEDEEKMEETIYPSGMLKHIGPIDITRKLFKKLRTCANARSGKLRIWDYGYDWRLSPPLLSRKLQEFLQKLPSNKNGVSAENRGALVVAHSLGGLITRHAVNQRPDLFSGVLYVGTPQRCINILGPLRNGDVVLFNEKLLTAAVNFSIRTSFVFLPEDGSCFVNKATGERYPVNFYDAHDWVKWHLSPCVEPSLPAYNRPPPQPSSLSSIFPSRLRSDSKPDKRPTDSPSALADKAIAPVMNNTAKPPIEDETGGTPTQNADVEKYPPPSDPDRQRNFEYLTRTLAMIRKFRSELHHSEKIQSSNAYPPHAVMYGKSVPTVFAAQVENREAISHADAYDDLLFRPGDGIALAKEAMLPPGYALVRGGRICTERGHITMLGDYASLGKALHALVRGRQKGIGFGDV